MKDIINGKRYNTRTATKIGEDSYLYETDFHWWEEALYRTPKGAWFTVGSGGALSHYQSSCGDGIGGSNNVFRTLSSAEALAWCENHGVDAETISKYFEIEDA